jgi:hypothetical protein
MTYEPMVRGGQVVDGDFPGRLLRGPLAHVPGAEQPAAALGLRRDELLR